MDVMGLPAKKETPLYKKTGFSRNTLTNHSLSGLMGIKMTEIHCVSA
jgi:hypothetical protein